MSPTNYCLIMWMYELCVGCAWKRTAVCGRACALCTCCESLYTVSVSMCARPPACLRVCFHRCPVGCFGWRYTCVFGHVCVCMTEWVSRGAGQRAAPLRGRVLFSRRLHLSSRCHTSCWYAHCQSHRARVAQRGDEGHGERVCVCVCARGGWVQNEAAVL